ncbi:MAG: Uma2 family endonuclease [Eubacteriales bacterium]|jgi:Uma2 family endonuclease|nr:Uma2 family endonuclease [Eubacteriales bacterium]MDD3931720.1 Uma2 family endonuclease [Eubacteriales bacterium]MDD4462137.1 Uma2 family endonuclease [Eubacteriales bacterium]
MKVSATDMKNYFGKYLEKCKQETILITKNDRVVAKLDACEESADDLMLKEDSAAYAWSGKRVSYEEFCEITENNEDRYEYIDGEIYLLAAPGVSHQMFLANLYTLFNNWFMGKPCRVFFSPFDVTLANDALKSKNVVEPDLLVSCDYLTQRNENDRYTGIPALVVEILSPGTRGKDQLKKLNVYLNGGVREYWIVDPRDRKVMLYYFADQQLEDMDLFRDPAVVKSIHFPGLEVSTTDIFAD